MRLLLSVARRRETQKWICHSCRASSILLNPVPSSKASKGRKEGPARTRFAPSPTGYLHLGSLRTALYNYLIAKSSGGQFILRIEDTDQARTVPDAEERLYEDLRWAGIEWDEGPGVGGPYGPYKQSERTEIYKEAAEKLVESDHAYRCFCSHQRLDELARLKAKLGLPPDYDRACYSISKEESDDRASKGEKFVVRLRAPEKYPQLHDLVYGIVKQQVFRYPKIKVTDGFDDPILLKTDGFPTYHLANVVDDHMMEITDVIRGSEWMSSTPKHLQIYQAFGWTPPNFAHVGLLVNHERQKLSKRGGSLDVRTYRNEGYFPVALNNFVALLGWSHRQGSDVMNMEDLIKRASLKYTKGNSVVAFEKLAFLQRKHTARYAALEPTALLDLAVRPIVKTLESRAEHENFSLFNSYASHSLREEYILSILVVDAQNYLNPNEFIKRNIYFLVPPSKKTIIESMPSFKMDKIAFKIHPDTFRIFDSLLEIPDQEWNTQSIRERVYWMIGQGIMSSSSQNSEGVGLGPEEAKRAWSKMVHAYLRWALNAGRDGFETWSMMAVLGKPECERRLKVADWAVRTKAEEQLAGGQVGEES